MKNIILIAPPAAGKGTLASLLKAKYNYAHISVGDLLRDEVKKGGELGQKIHQIMLAGKLVSNDIVSEALVSRLSEPDCKNGYILDGYPRSLEQAIEYEEVLKKLNQDLGLVIVLDIDKEILINRTTGRRMCKECGTIYNIYSTDLKPKKEDSCDKCEGELYQRADDNIESFEKRYQTFLTQTTPVIDYYDNKGVLYHVDSTEKEIALAGLEKILFSEDNID
ncbi:MAG: nucleoside monophosphate kinase [Tenericutes bacterium]|jgi:adenylate kinase|nr:nucleoside monophosphate kinase [Mycoplasmatota bacterium]